MMSIAALKLHCSINYDNDIRNDLKGKLKNGRMAMKIMNTGLIKQKI